MVLYIYSNLIGSFVLNTQFRVIDKAFFSQIRVLKNSAKLERGEWIDEEKALISKHGHKMFCACYKKTMIGGIEPVSDERMDNAAESVASMPDFFSRMRDAGIALAKARVRDSVKSDVLLVQAVSCIDEIDRAVNTFSKRLREWYELYLPEFSKSLRDNFRFAEVIAKKGRKDLMKELGIKESMGSDVSERDLSAMICLAKEISAMEKLRKLQVSYIERCVSSEFPNLNAVAGAMIGAKLIRSAGRFERLAKMPASTVQVLGAEEALFRHLKTGAKSPKYGIIHEHRLVSQAKKQDKGKAARALADKISIAVKVDFFRGDFVGKKLIAGLEKRFGK